MPSRFDSYAPIVADLVFETTGGKRIKLDAHEYLQSIEVQVTSEAAWAASLTLFDHEGGYLEDLIIAAGLDRNVEFKWGWDSGDGLASYPPWRGLVVTYTPTFTPEGVTIQIDLVPIQLAGPFQDKTTVPRSFAAGKTATEIFREIAAKWGWDKSPMVVEESEGTLDELVMGNESDLRFLRETLAPKAVKDGQHFLFYISRDGTAHFHTRAAEPHVGAVYNFARSAMGDVLSFAPSDQSFFGKLWGAGKAVAGAIDSMSGTRIELETTDEAGVSGVPNVVEQDSAWTWPSGKGASAVLNLLTRDPDEFRRRLTARIEALRDQQYLATLEVRGTHAVLPPQYVVVNYYKLNGKLHYLSGTFRVLRLTHNVDTSGWRTTMELQRGGTRQPEEGGVQRAADRRPEAEVTEETQDTAQDAARTAEGRRPSPGIVYKQVRTSAARPYGRVVYE